MDNFTQKYFLKWLVYIVIVASLSIGGIYLGIFQTGFLLDKSHLSIVISVFYIFTEIYMFMLSRSTSNQIELLKDIEKELESGSATITADGDNIIITKSDNISKFKNASIANYIRKLMLKKTNTGIYDHKFLLESFLEKIYNKNSWGETAIGMIILFGLLGTIIGIIITFWPFMSAGTIIDIAKIQNNIGTIFAGVGAAFYPSAFATIYALLLHFNNKNLNNATTELNEKITDLSEIHLSSKLGDK